MTPVDENDGWDRVPAYVQREIDRLGGSIRSVSRDSGVDARTITKLVNGQPVTRRPALVRLATHFGWEPDGFDRIREGREPYSAAEQDIRLSASGVDLEELRLEDPESYEQIMGLARLALDRARERRLRG